MQDTKTTTRRAFIHRCTTASLIGATYTLGITPRVHASISQSQTKTIHCFNIHTQESISAAFYKDGHYEAKVLQQLNLFLRDHRENKSVEMDVMLYEQLWQLQHAFGNDVQFDIISGYRTSKTNSTLRKKSNGVASKSYHMLGQAIDLRAKNIGISELHNQALAMNAGGVGYYPKSNFIHLDTGPIRHWQQK